jgi:hypothetical protein
MTKITRIRRRHFPARASAALAGAGMSRRALVLPYKASERET